jgi:hypothetical protein
VQIDPDGFLQLTYCTNIHAADGWAAVDANIRRYAPALKARLSPRGRFGIGLRISAREARELADEQQLTTFRDFLDAEDLYVALINGFPHGAFHGTAVKDRVYAPDWQDPARAEYTLDLIRILQRLLPADLDGGVSTAPLSYKPWMARADASALEAITGNIVRVAAALVRAHDEHGSDIHLDIEPEPDCLLETSTESIDFFERWLLPVGGPMLARALGSTVERAELALREHIRVCFDCCHFAVEYEEPRGALERLARAGIRIGRVQLSSAINVAIPRGPAGASAIAERLRPFADSTYLHQVVERGGGSRRHFPDLDDALREAESAAGRQWRIHFHVPLFTREYDGLGSTQDYVREILAAVRGQRFTRHLEIETYTWDVLPGELKVDLLDSIAREYEWVLATYRDETGSAQA